MYSDWTSNIIYTYIYYTVSGLFVCFYIYISAKIPYALTSARGPEEHRGFIFFLNSAVAYNRIR